MKNLKTLVEEKCQKALHEAFGRNDFCAEVTQSTQPQFGDYQCNNPLKIGKELKISPRLAAEKIVENLERSFFSKVEIAGPGFINLTIDPSFLAGELHEVITDSQCGAPKTQHPQKIVVEFSSPNVAKELHVGHLRSTIIGDCLARVFEFLGHSVLRLNHIGDWGTQFGMLIAYLREEQPRVLEGKERADLLSLMNWYRASKQRFDVDPEFKKRAQLEVVKLQGGDEVTLAAWSIICDISRKSYQEIYDLLDVKLIERGESFYNPYLKPTIDDLEKRGMIQISDGAKCIYLEGFINREGDPLPIIIQKSDGGYNYDTTDMAAVRHRIDEEGADRIIIVTDAGQSLHFQMIFKAAEMAGYLDPQRVRTDHVPFGVVLGADGKKFKTRSGDTERLMDLLTEAISHARSLLKEKLPHLNEAELEEAAHILGIDAIKYADLASHRIKDYVFSYERMLRFEGNTAAFLLYAYVRTQSIKRKVGKEIYPLVGNVKIVLEHPTEVALAMQIRQLGETLDAVAEELLPNRLCDYLFKLAEKFHAFFRDCRVEGSELEESRLLLCEAAGRTLKTGLHLLGLKTLERM